MDIRIPIERIAEGCVMDYRASSAPATERVQNGDFSSDVGWNTSGAAWTIALGVASNNTAGQFLRNALVTPILAGASVTATVVVTDNPAVANWMLLLYNTSTLASQALLSISDGPGTYTTAAPVIASGAFDEIRIRAIADPGLILTSVSVFA